MPIIRWRPFLEPWEEFERFFEEPLLSEKISSFVPPIDVYETKDKVVVETFLPGVDPEKVDISIEDNTLTIKGKSEKKTEVEEKDYYRKEVRYGSFYRAVTLPIPVQKNKTKATSKNGMLKIEISKALEAKSKGRKVKVKPKK